MDDLISREAVLKHQFTAYIENMWHMTEDVRVVETADIKELPSAFEGMTKKEIISKFVELDDSFAIMVDEVNGTVNIELSLDFWNAPYKAESEDK